MLNQEPQNHIIQVRRAGGRGNMMTKRIQLFGIALAASSFLTEPAFAQSSAAPFTTGYRYDAKRQLTGVILPDPDGTGQLHYAATRNSYDGSGRLIKVETGELSLWQTEAVEPSAWNAFTVIKIVEAQYDGLDHKTKETVKERVNGVDIVRAVSDYSYDPVGRLVCTAVRMNPTVAQSNACVPQVAAPEGPDRITKNVYDAVGRVVQIREGVGLGVAFEAAEATYSYTFNGKKQFVIDAAGNRAQLVYDGHDRQIQWIFPSKTKASNFIDTSQSTALSSAGLLSTQDADPNNDDFESYTYDLNGNRKTLRKRDGRILKYEYDALNRITSKCVTSTTSCVAPNATTGRDVYYAYDLMGHQTSAKFDSASGANRLTNNFNGFGDLEWSEIAMAGGPARRLTHHYDLNGNRDRLTHPDGVYFTIGYDGLDRMQNASWTTGTGTTPFMAITYDNGGRRSNINRGSSDTGYGYDNVARLTSMNQRFAAGVGNANLTFGHNSASQIIGDSRDNDDYAWAGAQAGAKPYTTNGLNQYTAAGAASYTYDANGNLTGEPGVTYVYDAENRLVSDSTGSFLEYDPTGRLWKISKGAALTQLLYDGNSLVAEYDAAGTMSWRYFFGPNTDEPILADPGGALACSNGTRFLHSNHQGSIVALADCWGARQGVNAYDEYGLPKMELVNNQWVNRNQGRFQYTGQAWIPEIGMYHYKARIYSPSLGRFLQVDPIGYDDQTNLYAYVGNDPLNAADPDGLCIAATAATNTTRPTQICQMASSLRTSQRGRAFIEKSEGRRKDVYPDSGNLATVGVGHLVTGSDKLKMGDVISDARIDAFYSRDLAKAETGVRDLVGKLPVSQEEFDGLADATYNVGKGRLMSLTDSPGLNKAIAAGNYNEIGNQLRYTKDKSGKSPTGLIIRNDIRQNIFLNGIYGP